MSETSNAIDKLADSIDIQTEALGAIGVATVASLESSKYVERTAKALEANLRLMVTAVGCLELMSESATAIAAALEKLATCVSPGHYGGDHEVDPSFRTSKGGWDE